MLGFETKRMRLSAAVLTMVMAAMLMEVCRAAVYKVGDSAGWTIIINDSTNVDYHKWASSKAFRVGDTIVFEYKPKFHNVMQVRSYGEYRSCNATTPLATYASGHDSFTIRRRGHYYFFCGFPGHCQAGQKVDIRVASTSDPPSSSSSMAPAPAPAVPPSNIAAALNPAATRNGASASHPSIGCVVKIVLAVLIISL